MIALFRAGIAGALLLILWNLPAGAEGPAGAGIVVLRNGEVLVGQATLLGERYTIELGNGSEIRLPAAEVDLVCQDLEEAYAKKRQALPTRNATAQLDLAEWCLRQNMHAKCAEQLLEVMDYAPENKRLPQLEERLRSAAHQVAAPAASSGIAPGPTLEQLELAARGLSPAALEKFVDTVQPLLLNRCAASGCHGNTATASFKLMRPAPGTSLTRRFTQRNLYAVLQLIDHRVPENSPLLTAPASPHGTAKTAIFSGPEQNLQEQLAEWVKRVTTPDAFPTGGEARRTLATEEGTQHEGLNSPATARRATMKALYERYQAANGLNVEKKPLRQGPAKTGAGLPVQAPASRPGAAPRPRPMPTMEPPRAAADPVDPVDPAAFNEQARSVGETPAAEK